MARRDRRARPSPPPRMRTAGAVVSAPPHEGLYCPLVTSKNRAGVSDSTPVRAGAADPINS